MRERLSVVRLADAFRQFRFIYGVAIVFLSFAPFVAASAVKTQENPDGSLAYVFENGVQCHKRADYRSSVQTEAFLQIKELFTLGGKFDNKGEKLTNLTPEAQEFEALRFDVCFEYGAGRINLEQYQARQAEIDRLQETVLKRRTDEAPTSGGGPSIHVETHGKKSPAIGNVKGNATIRY